MPTLPEPPEPPAGPAQRLGNAVRATGRALGTDARVTWRVYLYLIVLAIGVSTAVTPWAQLSIVALIGLALDWARRPIITR